MKYTIAGHICWLVGAGLIGYVSIAFGLSLIAVFGLFGAGLIMEIGGICLGTGYARKKYMDELYKNLYKNLTGKK